MAGGLVPRCRCGHSSHITGQHNVHSSQVTTTLKYARNQWRAGSKNKIIEKRGVFLFFTFVTTTFSTSSSTITTTF